MEENKKIIEVNGIKMEIDLREAKIINNYKVGDSVKLLKKSYSDYKSHLAVIVGFDEFEKHPTIIIAYLDVEFSSASIKFEYINSETKDAEICPVNEWDIPYSKQDILDRINTEIEKKKEEIRSLESKRKCFVEMFGKYFENK